MGALYKNILTDNLYRGRPGARVAKRRRCQAKIGVNHRINENETIKWVSPPANFWYPSLC